MLQMVLESTASTPQTKFSRIGAGRFCDESKDAYTHDHH